MKNGRIENLHYDRTPGKLLTHDDHKTWLADPMPSHDAIVKKWYGCANLHTVCIQEGRVDAAVRYYNMALELWRAMTPKQKEQANWYLEEPLPIRKEL